MSRWIGPVATMTCALFAACAPAPQRPTEHDPAKIAAQAAAAMPSDQHLATLYRTSCKACHGQTGSGAPPALDRSAWDPRWSRGLPALMQSVVSGRSGMPAGGQCFACTVDDDQALIRFMADRPKN